MVRNAFLAQILSIVSKTKAYAMVLTKSVQFRSLRKLTPLVTRLIWVDVTQMASVYQNAHKKTQI
jgi:hypothetical protein